MYQQSEKYNALCNAPIRQFKVYVADYKKTVDITSGITYTLKSTYTESSGIISVKATRGQTSGGYKMGDALSGAATIVTTLSSNFEENDKVTISVSFIDGNGAETEQRQLGVFYVQEVKNSGYTKSIDCVDGMTLMAKDYEAKTADFPMSTEQLFNLLPSFIGETAEAEIFNNPTINDRPYKSYKGTFVDYITQEEIPVFEWYSYRELAGYISGLNGGSAFFTADGKLSITAPSWENPPALNNDIVISYSDNQTKHKIGRTIVTNDPIEIAYASNPLATGLVYAASNNIISFPFADIDAGNTDITYMENINSRYRDKEYTSIIIKKRGTGFYDLGQVVTYNDTVNNKDFGTLMICGISYNITASGGFTETLYSLALTAAQKSTQGVTNAYKETQSEANKGYSGTTKAITNASQTEEILTLNFSNLRFSDGNLKGIDDGGTMTVEIGGSGGAKVQKGLDLYSEIYVGTGQVQNNLTKVD